MSLDPRAVRLSSAIGTDLLTAECLLPGCRWAMTFSWAAQRLGTIIDVCGQHPCIGQMDDPGERT